MADFAGCARLWVCAPLFVLLLLLLPLLLLLFVQLAFAAPSGGSQRRCQSSCVRSCQDSNAPAALTYVATAPPLQHQMDARSRALPRKSGAVQLIATGVGRD
ncbi:unnamed protein product [Polarella glacialis]|uniref:Uncharacterized protein n=1 Tax=Polarella glacialis TaxID=89957 RepID=A0A813ERR5_POLGL|nr:unnamed protein product [Polarella glacialis]